MEEYVIIDNGHGRETAGKCSPDGKVKEWVWTRAAARELRRSLAKKGIESVLLVPEENDISLRERCTRANALWLRHRHAVLVSLHSNASGDGSAWGNANGWSVFIAAGASAESENLARCLFRRASTHHLLGNRLSPPEMFNRANLAICRDTHCPAVLTENMFHDNRADAAFLASPEGIATIVALHAEGISDYFTLHRT